LKTKSIISRNTRHYFTGYLFILPCLLLLILMMVNPIAQMFKFSFSELTLPKFDTHFIGLGNYRRMISRPEFWTVIMNTFTWVIGTVALRFVFGLWGAITMNGNIKGVGIFRFLILLPWTVPSIVASNLWRWILQSDFGLLNTALTQCGLGFLAHSWLGDSNTALTAVILAYTWAGFPFVMMMLLAGMQSIPEEMYDAGKVDGANGWQLFRFITIPFIQPIIIIVLILEVISALNAFDMLYVLTGGGPSGSTEILGLLIYRLGFTNYDFAGASAISVLLLLLTSSCFLLYAPYILMKKESR
jgi:multiple sugar transport system permease protein